MNTDDIVKEISGALSTAKQILPFSKRGIHLTMMDAYTVASRARALCDETALVGRKIGFTNRGIWDIYGVDQPIWGDMRASSVHFCEAGKATIDLGRFCEPRLEPEVVICLKDAPVTGCTDAEIAASIDWVAPGFEIVDSIYPNWSFCLGDAIATGSLHGCLLVGAKSKPTRQTEVDLLSVQVRLLKDNVLEEEGSGANVLDGPVSAIRFLMEGIESIPGQRPLAAGDIITTGTMTDAKPIASGQDWRAEFSGLLDSDLSIWIK